MYLNYELVFRKTLQKHYNNVLAAPYSEQEILEAEHYIGKRFSKALRVYLLEISREIYICGRMRFFHLPDEPVVEDLWLIGVNSQEPLVYISIKKYNDALYFMFKDDLIGFAKTFDEYFIDFYGEDAIASPGAFITVDR